MAVDLIQIFKWYLQVDNIQEYEKRFENGTVYYYVKYIENSNTYIKPLSISEIEIFKVKYDL